MPSLVGFTNRERDERKRKALGQMLAVADTAHDAVASTYAGDEVCAGLSLHAFQKERNCRRIGPGGNLHVWALGELYDTAQPTPSAAVAAFICDAYNRNQRFDLLARIDGVFCAALWDSRTSVIHLISDRYGQRPMYWALLNGNLVFASSLNVFCATTKYSPTISASAVEQFLTLGYQLENQTWFEHVKLLPPASVLRFNCRTRAISIRPYWRWDSSAPATAPSPAEAAEELGSLFCAAVRRRIDSDDRLGILLSGGLDSRALAAAAVRVYDKPHLFTFGDPRSDDVRIARQAAMACRAPHDVYAIDESNWLPSRVAALWRLGASCSILDLHGAEFLDEYAFHGNVLLSGLAGDLIVGGSYLLRSHLDACIDSSAAQAVAHMRNLAPAQRWREIPKTDPFFIENRVRRFTNSGPLLLADRQIVRTPFLDTALMDFIYGLPDRYRLNGMLYHAMLLREFPACFEAIPWQKTGVAIGAPAWLIAASLFRKRAVSRLRRELSARGLSLAPREAFVNYPALLRGPRARRLLERTLLAEKPLCREFIPRRHWRSAVADHLAGRADNHVRIGRLLTLELWLRQALEGTFRTVGAL